MKKKFACIGFSYLFGLLAFSMEWGKYNYLVILLVLSWTVAALITKSKYSTYILVMAFCFFVGIAYGSFYIYSHYNKIIAYDGKEITIKGYVCDYNYTSSDTGILTVKGEIEGKVDTTISFFVTHENYEYYEEVEITGTVEKISDSVDFLSEQYNRAKGVFLQGHKVYSVVRTGENHNVVFKAIKNYRDYMFSKINSVVGGEEGGFLGAMLCGDKSQLSYETKLKLYRTGIGHIFCVSGTHLVIISAFIKFFLRLFRFGKNTEFVLTEIITWSFVVFSGMSPSVIRSAIMVTVLLLSDLLNRHDDCLNTLGLCCILLTMGNPYIVRNSSFLLSMTCVFALGVVAPKVTGTISYKGPFRELIVSIVSMLTLMFTAMPVTLLFFNEISLASPVANIILLPICTFALEIAVVAAATGGISFIAQPILKFSGLLVGFVLDTADKISSFRYSYVTISDKEIKITAVVISFAALLIVLSVKTFKHRVICALTAYMAFILTFNISKIITKDEIHMVIIPGDGMNQTVIYKSYESVVLDNNAKGEHNKAIQRLAEKQGITQIKLAAVTKGRYYSASNYLNNCFPVPEKIVSDFQDSECRDYYSNSQGFDFYNAKISMEDDCFLIAINNEDIIIKKNELYLSGVTYSLSEDDYPWEVVYNDNKLEVRRLDYGFDEQ